METIVPFSVFAPVDPWAKSWPTDLAIPSSSPAQAEIFSNVSFIAQVLWLSSAQRPDMTELLLKRIVKLQVFNPYTWIGNS